MGDASKIEWTDATWNPIVGCSKVSAGCDNCYAIGVAHRGLVEHHKGLTVRTDTGIDWNDEIHLAPDSILNKPLTWKRPRRIFVNSLSDLFHPKVSYETILSVFAVMSISRQHTFQVLTKRPQRMSEVLTKPYFSDDVEATVMDVLGARYEDLSIWREHEYPVMFDDRWLPNVWLGVSIESDKYAWRADYLRDTPAAVRFISAEPLLGPLPSLDLEGVDWLIVGGESGTKARPMHPEWVRDLRDRCQSTCRRCGQTIRLVGDHGVYDHGPAQGNHTVCDWRDGMTSTDRVATPIPFLFKQHGSWRWAETVADNRENSTVVRTDGYTYPLRQPGPWSRIDDAVTNRVPKSQAGRLLDGRTWDEYPL